MQTQDFTGDRTVFITWKFNRAECVSVQQVIGCVRVANVLYLSLGLETFNRIWRIYEMCFENGFGIQFCACQIDFLPGGDEQCRASHLPTN